MKLHYPLWLGNGCISLHRTVDRVLHGSCWMADVTEQFDRPVPLGIRARTSQFPKVFIIYHGMALCIGLANWYMQCDVHCWTGK